MAFLVLSAFWRTFELKKPKRELKWRHDMSGEQLDKGVPMQVVVNMFISPVDFEFQNVVY